ncbi:hypothetical protein C8R45DRAFT_888353 [Mycena sanguinolenta]|nr:hypothetical protein C8R45DRAFT_888353 [Mycena sanguinolenta]
MHTQLRRRLAELDAQISDQKRVLDQLLRTRSDVERELHATATYPVLTLPVEVTAEIFLHCLGVLDPPSIPQSSGSAPIVLSRVCRAWRDIAFSTPILWSQLRVQFERISPSKKEPTEGIVDGWLSRAKYHPLSLDFSYRDVSPERLRDMIRRWSHRVERLRLDIYSGCDIHLLELDSAAFPLLQGATLRCPQAPNLNPQRSAILFGDAVHFHDLKLPFNLHGFTLPWPQLTKFHGALPDLRLFTLAPNLAQVTCTFYPAEDHYMMITHRTLRSLTIGDDDTSPLLKYLTLPALQCLDISNIETYDRGDLELVMSFLRRSSPPLASVSFSGYQIAYWAQCIPLVADTLKTLELIGPYDQDGDCLNILGTSVLATSNIQSLSFRTLDPSDDLLDLGALVRFLYARSDKIRTFRAVWAAEPFLDRMVSAGPPGTSYFDTISDHLWRLGQTGMEIYFQTECS